MIDTKPIYVIVTPFFPSPENWRGPYCYDFAKAVVKDGRFDVRVFVPGDGEAYEYHGIRVKTFRQRMLPSSVFPFLFERWNAQNFLKACQDEGVELSAVAVCHAHTAFYSVYALAMKKMNPSCLALLHHHDPQSFGLNTGALCHFWPYNFMEYPILRKYHEKIDIHVFISKVVKESFINVPNTSWTSYQKYKKQFRGLGFYRGVNINKSLILHNGIDTSLFNSIGRLVNNSDKFTIGCIGNFCDWKDQITLLRAVEILIRRERREITVRLIGTGPLLNMCKDFVRESGIQEFVSFEKECDHSLLPLFFRSLDLFVLPSYFEGFGCVFTESWACGTPFITCEGQGMDELIPARERRYWLAKVRSSEDLTRKILFYMENRSAIKQHLNGEIDIDKLVPRFLDKIFEDK